MPEIKEPYLQQRDDGIYEWHPGNSTRYLLALTETGRGWLVAWLINADVGGHAFLVFPGSQSGMSISYFMEKMNLRLPGDAIAILDFLVKMKIIENYDR